MVSMVRATFKRSAKNFPLLLWACCISPCPRGETKDEAWGKVAEEGGALDVQFCREPRKAKARTYSKTYALTWLRITYMAGVANTNTDTGAMEGR